MADLTQLVDIIKSLRGPNGCQWDKEQTIDSIKPYLLEETYEVIDSILNKDFDGLREELGDLLCQVVFLSQLSQELDQFDIQDVIDGISDKLVHRHPHVFGDVNAADTDEILKNWEIIKSKEAKNKNRQSVLDGVPKTLPSLTKASRTQEKASRVGFDWKDKNGAIAKVEEEFQELKDSMTNKNHTEIENELGDLLFSMVNLSRFVKIDPEFALQRSVDKFSTRFRYIESKLKLDGISFEEAGLERMDQYWDEAKVLNL